MKNSTKCFLFLTTTAIAGMYAYNKFTEDNATSKNLLSVQNGDFFYWTQGDIFYTKQGSGSPILLVHDIDSSASSYEWNRVVKRLEKEHTVYTMDLLGCGRSDKPNIIYTNYLYVQLLTAFVKNVIKEKTDVIATNMSASSVIMANHIDADLFDKMIFINPASIKQLKQIPDQTSKIRQTIMNLPLIGTFLYNIMTNPTHISQNFREKYFNKPQLISSKMEDVYYEAAHLGESNGKYLHSSLTSNYVNVDITNAIKKIEKPVYIIGSRGINNNIQVVEEYKKKNKNFDITLISNSNLYPQLEIPDKLTQIINNCLSK